MKFFLLNALASGLKPLFRLFQDSPRRSQCPGYSLPRLPSVEWELELRLQHNRSIRTIAKFFFGLGLTALLSALTVMLWQTSPVLGI